MSTQQTHRHKDEDEPSAQETEVVPAEKPNHDDLDRLLDEMEDILNFDEAEEFVRSYVQKGGQ